MDGPEVMDASNGQIYEILHPYMVTYGILGKKTSPLAIQEADLAALATRWKVKAVKDKRKDGLIRALYAHCEQFETRTETRKYGATTFAGTNMLSVYSESSEHVYFEPDKKPHVRPLRTNYFGLPIHALAQTPAGLVYRGRKPNMRTSSAEEETSRDSKLKEDENILAKDEQDVEEKQQKKENFVAQRKVAKALLAIASNPATVTHFVKQGGMDAIFKLAFESHDADTLTTCARCIAQAADTVSNRRPMMDKQVSLPWHARVRKTIELKYNYRS